MVAMENDPTTPADPETDRDDPHRAEPDPWLGPPRGTPPELPVPRFRSTGLMAWSSLPLPPPLRPRGRRHLPAPVRGLPADLAA